MTCANTNNGIACTAGSVVLMVTHMQHARGKKTQQRRPEKERHQGVRCRTPQWKHCRQQGRTPHTLIIINTNNTHCAWKERRRKDAQPTHSRQCAAWRRSASRTAQCDRAAVRRIHSRRLRGARHHTDTTALGGQRRRRRRQRRRQRRTDGGERAGGPQQAKHRPATAPPASASGSWP